MADGAGLLAPTGQAGLSVVGSWQQAVDAVIEALHGETDPRRPDDPFRLPLLVVPSRAHARAIAEQLATRDGVAVGLSGVLPGRLRGELETTLLGLDPAADPWRIEPLAVRISSILQDADEPWAGPVRAHIDAMTTRGATSPRWDTAWRTAVSLSRVASGRPELLKAWAEGGDVRADGQPLDAARAWWAPLWRRLLGQDLDFPDPPHRHALLMAALAEPSVRLRWSRCAWLAGASTTRADRELAVALGRRLPTRVVHLDHGYRGLTSTAIRPAWSPFNRVRPASRSAWEATDGMSLRRADPSAARNPSRDDAGLLGALIRPGGPGDPKTPAPALSADGPISADNTVAIHDCHGPDRQVEVVRDVLCQAIADLPGLEPRDIVIVCPDHQVQEALLAALVSPADSGVGQAHPARGLRVQPPGFTTANPVAEAVVTVLGLGSSRAGGSQLVELCAMPAVARRFSFSSDDQADIARLIADAGVRWGLDSAARARAGLPRVRQSTWLAGIERMLLGAAMSTSPPGWLATVTPVDGVDSADIDLVGRLAELVSRLRRAVMDCQRPATAEEWSRRITQIVTELTASAPGQAWQGPATVGTLARLSPAGPEATLGAGEIIGLLEARIAERRPPIWFDGSAHICGPGDLDAIAHDVVILVEPDSPAQTVDPLRGLRADDDVESDPAATARQLLIDAVASARRRLVVVRQAHDPVTNAPVLPGPFVTALDEALASAGVDPRTVHLAHGLQPFSATEYASGTGWRSFDPVCASAAAAPAPGTGRADARLAAQVRIPPLLPAPASVGTGVWSPAGLTAILVHPARALLRARLGTGTRSWHEDPVDELPLELGPLDSYGVRARLLNDLEQGASPEDARTAERLRGSTPPGRIGLTALNAELDRAATILATARRARQAGPERLIEVAHEAVGGDLPPLIWPEGSLAEPDRRLRIAGRVRVWGDAVVRSSPSRASARDLLALWIDLLAVAAGRPGQWRGVLACNSAPWTLVAPGPQLAADLLSGLARAAWWSTQQLVPLPLRTAAVLAGLVNGPRADWRTGRSGVGVQWERECDDDWAVFLDDDEDSLRAACQALGTSAEDLARWFFEPLGAAAGRIPGTYR
ncbi:MAG: exodeoxyribonuclease V subunit gamma [Acidipropionibacterium sp.]|jgi:exodeoxyribonuclease V gamma subunit|nr:exodeoxyribonuclease V subunit gamma [Acidipropionibacterium sp.]